MLVGWVFITSELRRTYTFYREYSADVRNIPRSVNLIPLFPKWDLIDLNEHCECVYSNEIKWAVMNMFLCTLRIDVSAVLKSEKYDCKNIQNIWHLFWRVQKWQLTRSIPNNVSNIFYGFSIKYAKKSCWLFRDSLKDVGTRMFKDAHLSAKHFYCTLYWTKCGIWKVYRICSAFKLNQGQFFKSSGNLEHITFEFNSIEFVGMHTNRIRNSNDNAQHSRNRSQIINRISSGFKMIMAWRAKITLQAYQSFGHLWFH